MKTTRYITICSAVLALSVSSCVKDDLYNTPHPDYCAIIVAADFAERSEGYAVPAKYILRHACCKVAEQTMPGGRVERFETLFEPGVHTLHAYTDCDKTSVADNTIAVDKLADGTIAPFPDYLFTAALDFEAEADCLKELTVAMSQRMRDLRFELTVTEGEPARIESITGRLEGVAGIFDLVAQRPAADVFAVEPVFVRNGDKVTAEVRLMGVSGGEQTLTLDLVFTDGSTQRINSDLTETFGSFGDRMTEAFIVHGNLLTPVESGFSATITDWVVVGNEEVEID